MLRRINAALFEAPPGARIQIVADAQGNNGVNDARFEYARQVLPRETILERPGCTFTVSNVTARLEAVVVFDPAAPAAARYDLFEVENGVTSTLQKFTRHSDSAPLIGFAIEPVPRAVEVATRGPAERAAVPRPAPGSLAGRRTPKKTPKKTGRKAAKKAVKRTVNRAAAKKAAAKPVGQPVAKMAARTQAARQKRTSTRKRGR